MDTPIEEQQLLQHITSHIAATQDEITIPGTLSSDTIAQAQMEVDRLDTLKASRMKEFVVKRRLELEDICRCIVDPTQLLSQMEKQIMQAKHEALTRKEILEKMEKWMSACEEEGWLEDYNKLSCLLHLSIRMQVRLLSMLDEYNYLRQEKDEEKRRLKPVTPEFSRPNGVMTNSRLGASMGKDTKRERSRPAAALNYVAFNKDEMAGLASTGGRSAAAVATGRGEQQQKVV
ncbi:unnamed protein product [Sphagnum troendelagicum]|uniref:Uncharacterized protein n=1 Tax=Sphagnum troendelagicum TaxID=128251 RepID=A0ABP0UIA7_9BRYO